MDKYRNFVVIEEIKGLLRQGKNEEALELTEGIDVRKLRDNYDCMILGEVFLNNGMLGKARECYSVIYNRKKNRRVALELVNICIRLKKVEDAEKYFDDYRKMAPNDYFNYIFRYKIDRLKGKPLKEQARSLEKLKEVEFFDTWGYELAKLYHKMGESEKCLKTCDDIIIWFGDGEAVDKARALKAYYSGEITLRDLNAPKNEKKPNSEDGSAEEAVSGNKGDEAISDDKAEATVADDSLEDVSIKELPTDETVETGEITGAQDEKETDEEAEIVSAAEVHEEIPEDTAEVHDEETEQEYTVEEISEGDENNLDEEDYIEEEYTEEDLSEVEADTIKVLSDDNNTILNDIKSVDREIGISTDDLARQVEAVLLEDSAERESRKSITDTKELTKVWNRTSVKDDKHEGIKTRQTSGSAGKDSEGDADGNTKTIPKLKQEDYSSGENVYEEDDAVNRKKDSPLLEAVERELGFVESDEKLQSHKKGFFSRLKEKRQEKEIRKQDEIRRMEQAEENERREREREAELEKKRFIEKEKKKDKQKFIDHQKQLAKLATEKAMSSMVESEEKQPKKEADDGRVDVMPVSNKAGNIYNPKRMSSVKVPEDSIVAGYLERTGKTLEDYFGFFACQKDMGEQILKCLEMLLDKSNDVMNYCIIGEKGNGKKAIAHGFAKFMSDCGMIASSQTVWTEASRVNDINLFEKVDKLKGRSLVINQAGTLEVEAMEDISKVVGKLHKKIMIVITDYRRNIVELFKQREAIEELFRPRISIPVFNQDDLFDYVDYKVDKAGFIFDADAYDLMVKRIKSIMRATDEGALARTEKYVVKTIDNAEQRNGEAYIKQTLEHTKHFRSNVIIAADLPSGI